MSAVSAVFQIVKVRRFDSAAKFDLVRKPENPANAVALLQSLDREEVTL